MGGELVFIPGLFEGKCAVLSLSLFEHINLGELAEGMTGRYFYICPFSYQEKNYFLKEPRVFYTPEASIYERTDAYNHAVKEEHYFKMAYPKRICKRVKAVAGGEQFVFLLVEDCGVRIDQVLSQLAVDKERVQLLIAVVEELKRIHEKNIVHCDVSAANIVVQQDSNTKIWCVTFIDFGRAALVGDEKKPLHILDELPISVDSETLKQAYAIYFPYVELWNVCNELNLKHAANVSLIAQLIEHDYALLSQAPESGFTLHEVRPSLDVYAISYMIMALMKEYFLGDWFEVENACNQGMSYEPEKRCSLDVILNALKRTLDPRNQPQIRSPDRLSTSSVSQYGSPPATVSSAASSRDNTPSPKNTIK